MSTLPKHVAIVMDGNGRWAKQRFLPRPAGNRAGAKAVRRAVEFCIKNGIEVLTLFAFSVENNAKRPATEISLLMSLFLESLQRNTEELQHNNVQITIVGDRQHFDANLLQQIERSEALTQKNTGLKLNIAINYSGRWDIVQATRAIMEKIQQGELSVADITETTLQSFLCLAAMPEPDLLIRTSGELRLSNFMLWQLAYTELFFTDVFWPDFDEKIFAQAVQCFQNRERRFGAAKEHVDA